MPDIKDIIGKFIDSIRTGDEAGITSFGSQAIQIKSQEILQRGEMPAVVAPATDDAAPDTK